MDADFVKYGEKSPFSKIPGYVWTRSKCRFQAEVVAQVNTMTHHAIKALTPMNIPPSLSSKVVNSASTAAASLAKFKLQSSPRENKVHLRNDQPLSRISFVHGREDLRLLRRLLLLLRCL